MKKWNAQRRCNYTLKIIAEPAQEKQHKNSFLFMTHPVGRMGPARMCEYFYCSSIWSKINCQWKFTFEVLQCCTLVNQYSFIQIISTRKYTCSLQKASNLPQIVSSISAFVVFYIFILYYQILRIVTINTKSFAQIDGSCVLTQLNLFT